MSRVGPGRSGRKSTSASTCAMDGDPEEGPAVGEVSGSPLALTRQNH